MSQFMEILSLEKNGKKKSKTGTKKWEMEWKYRSLNAYHIVPSKFTRQVLSHHSMKLRPRRVKELDQVQFSRSVVSDSLQPHEPQYARPPCPSPTPGVHPNPCPLSWWCHPTISFILSSPSPPAFNLSQHQGLFKRVSSLHQVARVLEFQLQHQLFQWTPRTDRL